MIYFPLYFQLLYQDFDGLCTCMISHFNHVQFFARILCPWDYPGKNSGMSWQTLLILWLQFSSVAQSCPTRCNPMNHFSSVQLLSRVRLFATPWIAAHQASLSITNSRSSLRLTSIKSVMPSSYLILCRPLLLLPPIPPSIRALNGYKICWRVEFNIVY